MLTIEVRAGLAASASHTITRRSGSGNGRGSSSSEWTTLKIAGVAPMPSASGMAGTAAHPGPPRSIRAPHGRARADERVPAGSPFGQDAASRRGDAVVPLAPLSRLFDPAAVDQAAPFHPVEQRVERGRVKGQDAVRPGLDQLRDLVAVARALLE